MANEVWQVHRAANTRMGIMNEKIKRMPDKSFSETLPNGFSFEMIFVEGGTFLMGSEDEEALDREKPVHQVELAGFYLGQYPVTQALWKAVMGNDNSPSTFKGDSRPVEAVSWNDAQGFIQMLNEMTGEAYRLPTEAEWEYAARGGKQCEGYKYAGSNRLKEVGWYGDNSYGETKPVGMKAPNELGLCDMSGNVSEWCWDWFDENYYGECHKQGIVENPKGPAKGELRVLRGGSWITPGLYVSGRYCRCTYRGNDPPEYFDDYIGFRLALSFQF